LENLTTVYTNTPVKGLVTDLDDSLISKDLWTHMRNGTVSSHKGNQQFLQNEPANLLCINLQYTPIGFVKILDNRWVIFSTDNTNSEIGIFNESNCTYEVVANNTCLNFNTSFLIRGAFKESFDGSETIYWTDSGRNPRRKLNLNKVPYKIKKTKDDACKTKEYTTDLDCDALLMTPKLDVPCINVKLGASGNLKNGVYQFGIAYTINQQRVSEFYSITHPEAIWAHNNIGQSMILDIDGIDQDFPEYELIVIYTQLGITTAKRIGFFNTFNNRHSITSVEKAEYINIPLEEIITKRPYYYAADDVVSNDQYILWSGVTSKPELNYQKTALKIKTKWVLYEVPADYYARGGNKKGYYRGEVYTFGIQWLYNTGEWSSAFHIAGRKPEGAELNKATGPDVYEISIKDCEVDTNIRNFEVYDTSKKTKTTNDTKECNEKIITEGDMSYWESTDTYPNNTIMFGDLACKPIRHHKFPSECNAPRYKNGGSAINILGVKFENIEHPKDENGVEIDTIVGYRIVRGDRKGNRSIISKGLFKNVRSYRETINEQDDNQEVLYPNYPYNDLRPDPFISSFQTYFKKQERDFRPLSDYKKDQFTFYSPETLFNKISLGDEFILDTEETGAVTTGFEEVFNHPRGKALNNSIFWLAITVGAIDGVLSLFGKKCVTSVKDNTIKIATTVGEDNYVTTTINNNVLGHKLVEECESLISGLSIRDVLALQNPIEKVAKLALKILQTAVSAGMAVYFAMNTAQNIIDTITEFQPYRKYALQANSKCLLNEFRCVERNFRRKHIDYYQYLYDGLNSVNGQTFNNFKREDSVYIKLNSEVANPKKKDTSRKTMSEAAICATPFKKFQTEASMYYGGIKRRITNQYGQIDSIRYLDTGYCVNRLTDKSPVGSRIRVYSTDAIFGGDTFISKMSIKSSHQFFTQNIANQNFPDGTEYDYTLYRNIGYPRFWFDSTKYDVGELIVAGKIPNKLPQNRYNFDCGKTERSNNKLTFDNKLGYFYLSNNGVLEFFVESEYNLDYRDYKNEIQNFYSKSYSNLTELFRSDRLDTPEEFVYDESYSKELVENSIFQQVIDYDPLIKYYEYYKNRVIYSLPAFKDQKSDNWLTYLTNNYYDFPMSEFGNLTGMHAVDNQQIMFLFDKSAPYITIGRDELQLDGSGTKVTIGDGGLFAREPRPLLHTDYYYGNSQSRWAFINTQFGSFYPSQRQGRIFNYSGKIDEISRQGMHFWFKQFLPSKLLEQFPDFKDKDNPVTGVGLLTVFDNTDEKYYITKRDYKLKDNYIGVIKYDPVKNQFSNRAKLSDTKYFDDISWTISYDPKQQAFISWHDWHPEWTIQGETHFMTVKDKSIWKHNQRCDLYCNFYGVDYPWEIEYLINNGPNVQILRSIEYVLEAGKYFQECRQFHQILDKNFDYLVVHNLEQISGYNKLILGEKSKMSEALNWPQVGFDEFLIKYDKEENKIRINQFKNIVKDRGEFSGNNFPLWIIDANGYVKTIQSQAVNYNKSQFQTSKFRNMWHKVFLSKLVSGDTKYIFKFSNAKEVISPR
jgi:hypothetical protein